MHYALFDFYKQILFHYAPSRDTPTADWIVVMLVLCAAAMLACSISLCSAKYSFEFTIGTPFRPVVRSPASPLQVTQNVMQIRRGDATSRSSEYLRAIRAGNHSDGVYSRLQVISPSNFSNSYSPPRVLIAPHQSGNAPITGVEGGLVFLAPIKAGNQSFEVVIDTGSSDTWFVEGNFTCLDPTTSMDIPQDQCEFGPSYSLSSTAHVIADRNFNISYADGEFLNGAMLYENITLAGITVSQQEIGLVDYAAWYGDGTSSGLVGLAYASLTNQYPGTNPAADQSGDYIPYNPLFTTMYTRNQTSAVFSLALQRSGANTASSKGGILAIGGIPNIPHDRYFANASVAITGVDSASGAPEYQFYTITLDGWAFSNSSAAQFDVHGTSSAKRVPINTSSTSVIVDSGTSLVYAPEDVTADVAALYNPPATFDEDYGLYIVDCGAVAPVFGVVVDTKVLYVDPVDLVIDEGDGLCVTGVQSDGGGLTILGDVFLRNVLAVFDVGAGEMRFAARELTVAEA